MVDHVGEIVHIAATFDDELVRRIATAISDEARAKFNVAQSIGNYGRYAGITFWSPKPTDGSPAG